jgi:branched-chain amino acid transport system ATP-binding protein
LIDIIGLSTGYDDTPVLHDLNLTLRAGEVILILGPNGHGKTTLLRTISGLLNVWSGSIIFNGQNLIDRSPDQIVKAGIAHVPQGDLLFPDLTVLENLFMGAYLPGAWKNRKAQIEKVFVLFPILKERSGQLARTLSGGERRMLALGRGLMTAANLYLIDEPSLGLAPLAIEDVYKNVRGLVDQGLSIILVEENASHAIDLADQVYLMEGGRFVRSGKPENLLDDKAFQEAYMGL